MKTKTKLCFFVVALCSAQLISCKKDTVNSTPANSAESTENAAASGPVTDSSVNKGLVAWYTFNGDILDHSGLKNNVVFNSAKAATGKSGTPKTAYLFDGASSYMQVANSKSINPLKITLYAVVKPKGFYQGTCHNNYILAKETTDYDQGRYLLGYGDQTYYNYTGCSQPVATKYENFFGAFGDGGSTASGLGDPNEYVKLNQWYSIVYTFDGVHSKLYVNGVLRASATQQATTFTPTTTPLFIGKTPNSSYPYYFNGVIDEIRIYRRALNPSEVLYLYDHN